MLRRSWELAGDDMVLTCFDHPIPVGHFRVDIAQLLSSWSLRWNPPKKKGFEDAFGLFVRWKLTFGCPHFQTPNYHCAGHVSHQYPVTYPHGGWFKQMRFLLLEFPILKHTHRDWTQCLIISISHSIHDSHPIQSPCCVVKHTHVYQHLKYSWLYNVIYTFKYGYPPLKSLELILHRFNGLAGVRWWHRRMPRPAMGSHINRWLTQYIWYVHDICIIYPSYTFNICIYDIICINVYIYIYIV